MQITWVTYVIVLPLVFLASLVDSVAGGGGLISLPAYLIVGLPAHVAAGTNKLSAGIGATAATLRYYSGGKLMAGIGIPAALGALPGSWLGATTQQLIPAESVKLIMLIVIPIVAVFVLSDRKGIPCRQRVPASAFLPVSFVIGLVIGYYDGLVGPGTGTFLIMLFCGVLGLDPVTSSGTAKLVNWSSNIAALFSYLMSGQVIFSLGLPAALCSVLGGLLGANLALKRGADVIRKMMVVVLILLLVKMAYDLFA